MSSKARISKKIEKLNLKVSQAQVHNHDRGTGRFRSRRGRQRRTGTP